ncbi:MAG: META domain-containing protein [Bacillota bacterium]
MGAAAFRAAALALACAACTSVVADARTFDGTSWRVAAIDGRATPAAGDYRIEFRNGEITGRFGCNGWGGAYSVAGDTITAGRIIATQMACSDPAASFESEGFAILRQPMHLAWAAGETLTLANGAGSIRLKQRPH